jgi:site-specific DNA-cytosine methylase
MTAFGQYAEDDDTSSSLKARDYKDATDLVIEPTLYEPHHGDGRATEGIANTLAARMGTGVNNTPVLVERTITHDVIGTLQSRMHKGINHEGARDAEGNLPPEVWREEETNPTLNQFDQGDSRTVVAIVEPIAVQGSVVGRSDAAGPGGKGHGEEGDPMFTLKTTDRHAVATGTVRRLTPTECERLQGFPDGWTEGQADSHRYKQMGNAVAVPVVEWIINRLVEFDS